MADKRRGKKRKEGEIGLNEEEDKISKDEYKVANWMKKNLPVKKTKLMDYPNMQYFTGSKAVDALLESQFAPTLFPTRPEVVAFLDKMLRHDFFHRAMKVPISEAEIQKVLRRKKKGDKKDKTKENEEAESSHAEGRSDDPSASPRPTKGKKVRLEFSNLRYFEDCLDAYVWIYDPIPFHYWIIGTCIVLGAVAICLFPLWPPEVRKCVYHLSIAAAGCLCLIIVLVIVRSVLFCLIWCLTLGKHHFMLLPNLTADVGFFASFWPLYQYEYKESKGKKKKKDKDSDEEQEDEKQEEEEAAVSDQQDTNEKNEGDDEGENDAEGNDDDNSRSDSGSDCSSHKSQTGKDFEIVNKKDIEEDS